LIAAFLASLFVVGPGLAFAQKTPGARGKGRKTVSSFDDGGGTDLGTIEVEGKIYKPSVFFVLRRSSFSYEGLKIEQNFLHKIIKEAVKRPF
jgi:hypothetical protein